MQLFVLFAAQATEECRRDVAIATSRGRREVAMAVGQVGNQLALALWRADELVLAVRSARMCSDCAARLTPALQRFDDFPGGRNPPPSRYLPVVGTIA